ncbi:MAG TPA: hypothetical protein QF641_01830 [Candidatus Thalassarchaeaceae archaeon]|jgi:hypothetical protein|nr:hypothetical protein [Candidatus Thalassarchaeaceae archaeon]|tara:strand:- start:5995 stop:6597 length:603 start_codon:yes stop_codon:yes gene_type:complete
MQERQRFLLIAPLLLSTFLAISPMLIFPSDVTISVISAEDLSESQLDVLREMDIARTPADTREGKVAMNQAFKLENGEIGIGGTWEGEMKLGEVSLQSKGSRDIFFATLNIDGEWDNVIVAGSQGLDSISSIYSSEGRFSLFGKVNGESQFSPYSLNHDNGWSPTGFEAHFDPDEGWTGVWEIDIELLPLNSDVLWCGFV